LWIPVPTTFREAEIFHENFLCAEECVTPGTGNTSGTCETRKEEANGIRDVRSRVDIAKVTGAP
jgi:hypothetical protein